MERKEWLRCDPADEEAVRRELEETICHEMNEREWRFIRLRLGFDRGQPRTQEEMAELMEIPVEQIRERERRILRIRRSGHRLMKEFLEK